MKKHVAKVIWGSFLMIFSFYAVISCVQLGWGNEEIPLLGVIRAIDWTRLSSLYMDDCFVVFGLAVFLFCAHGLVKSHRGKLVCMFLGVISPILFIGPQMIFFIPLGPFVVWRILTGKSEGEDFVEGIPEAAAVGLLMILYSVLSFYHLYFVVRVLQKPDTRQDESLNLER